MRYVILLSLLLASSLGLRAQDLPIDPETGKIVYQEVVNVPGASADELFHKANYWLNTYFPSIQNQVEMIDSVNHEVVCKRYFQMHVGYFQPPKITITIKLQSKKEKYRYTIKDFNLFFNSAMGFIDCGSITSEYPDKCKKGLWKRVRNNLPPKMEEIISAMKTSITTEEDDW